MRKRGNAPDNHKWEPGWSEVEDEPVDKCIRCELMRRQRQNYVKGEMIRAGKVCEYLVNNE